MAGVNPYLELGTVQRRQNSLQTFLRCYLWKIKLLYINHTNRNLNVLAKGMNWLDLIYLTCFFFLLLSELFFN